MRLRRELPAAHSRRGGARARAAAAALVGLAALGACGAETSPDDEVGAVGDDVDGPAAEVPLGGEDPTLTDDEVEGDEDDEAVTAELEITAGVSDEPDRSGQAMLSCDEGGGAAGTLWLEGAAADEACRTLRDATAVAALDAPPEDQMCTEIFGGDEVATVIGTVEGLQVDAVLDRTDGCAISRWDVLQPLLPPLAGG